MYGRKYEQRDWKPFSYQEDSDWRKKSLQMPQVASHQDKEYTTRGEPYDVSRIIWFHPWSCQNYKK
eukprot:SAG22_NODE_2476_length_2530_cov_2.162896_6_plen_66_part_01